MTGKLVPLNDQAAAFGWRPAKLYRLVSQKRIPCVRVGREIFFEPSAVEQWLARQRQTDGAPVERTREAECAALGIPEWHEFR